MRSAAPLLAFLMLFTLSCGEAEKPQVVVEDIVAAAPNNVEQLLDNDSITVMRVTLPPRTGLPLHKGRERVVYSLSDYKLRYSTPGSEAKIQNFKPGDIHWHSPGVHQVQNVGPIPARYLVVARKGPNPTAGVTSNVAELAPGKARVVFENQDAKVIAITLGSKEKLPQHNSASRVVYALTPGQVKYTAEGKQTTEEWSEGAVHWHDGGMHQVENISTSTVKFLVFEMM